MKSWRVAVVACLVVCGTFAVAPSALGQQASDKQQQDATPAAKQPAAKQPANQPGMPMIPGLPSVKPTRPQAELDAELVKTLSGATLEGSFNTTGAGRDATRINADKYTLGQVKKFAGNVWTIEAQFQGQMIPLPVPILWAGNTPVITIDEFTIPGMGTYTARVMFFEDHYSGYWKHGDRGGNMFGVIHRAGQEAAGAAPAAKAAEAAVPASDASKK